MCTVHIYTAILLCSFACAAFLAVHAWRQRRNRAAWMLFWLECAIAEWALAIAFESAFRTLSWKLFWSQVAYLGTTTVPVLFFLLVVAFCFSDVCLRWWVPAAMFAFPLATCILAFSNPFHGVVWPAIQIDPATDLAVYSHGWWWWLLVLHSYLYLLGGGTLLFFSLFRFSAPYRGQVSILLLSAVPPIVGNLAYAFALTPFPGLDWTLVGFVTSGVLIAWAVLRLGLLKMSPIARSAVVEQMWDGFLVIDRNGILLDCNPMFLEMTQTATKPLPGSAAADLLRRVGLSLEDITTHANKPLDSFDTVARRHYHVHVYPVSAAGDCTGYALMIHDCTEMKRLEHERHGLLQQVKSVHSELKAVSGLLPICAGCKRVRNDQGYWQQVESYIRAHAGVQFTHGFCPECMRTQLGPELTGGLDEEFDLDRVLD